MTVTPSQGGQEDQELLHVQCLEEPGISGVC